MTTDLERELEAVRQFESWLDGARAATASGDAGAFGALFAEDGYWMDYLAFTWRYRTFEGRPAIEDAFARTQERARLKGLEISAQRARPRLARRSGVDVLEGYLDYEVAAGRGTAYVRLRLDDPSGEPRIWIMLTTLQELDGYPSLVGVDRPKGREHGAGPENWLDRRLKERRFDDREPEVVIVGGGHGGLVLGARLRQMGVDVLIVEKNARVGDNWRHRYHSLTLHNEVATNTLPYMPYPQTWPAFLPKDKLAHWLEAYAEAMELNVWTGAEVTSGERHEDGTWTLTVRRSDGERVLRVPHVVLATGGHSGVPNVARPEGVDDFRGRVMHSSEYRAGRDHVGERVVVMGTGSSAHDIAQDLYENGAASVTMVQRNPTAVISLDPCGTMVYAAYTDDRDPVDVDLVQAATPYPILKATYQWLTRKTCELDKDLIAGLEGAGFRTDFEPDATGFHMKYLRKGGGYYINAGCSDLIIDGSIAVLQAAEIDTLEARGLRLKDGSLAEVDTLVLATGYQNQQEGVRILFGDEIAEKVGPIWGFDENHVMRNMWVRTPQDGLWIMGGALMEARLYSTYLALQIRADLDGILPAEGLV
ncbi:monooxygenase [Aeromicrobium sp. Root495]|uniref:flavin-containing monooxygenase n=1 Tax=Aeromicrobium sp. Root495 TaxID=1736550 RepID=UPI0006F88316|nr:NAD(P)/FAD-dependent oxidoreductase [Aeromicrobium sp. Root495]KQY56139.1 monooxygenase [Aeromicrobium sp. Root495]RYJ07668.1 MAG: NAD(P)/FAD-dependent oxidoreductase [Actinomycetales bacterium]